MEMLHNKYLWSSGIGFYLRYVAGNTQDMHQNNW